MPVDKLRFRVHHRGHVLDPRTLAADLFRVPSGERPRLPAPRVTPPRVAEPGSTISVSETAAGFAAVGAGSPHGRTAKRPARMIAAAVSTAAARIVVNLTLFMDDLLSLTMFALSWMTSCLSRWLPLSWMTSGLSRFLSLHGRAR